MAPGLLAAFGVCLLAVMPVLSSDRDQAARSSQEREPGVRQIKLNSATVAAARVALADRERIAILPVSAPRGGLGPALAALGCTEAMTADLHYAPRFLVLDHSEVDRAWRELKQPREVGRKLGVRYVVAGTLTRDDTDDRLDVEAIEIGPDPDPDLAGDPARAAHASARRPVGQVYELVDEVLLVLLRQLKAEPAPERLAEMNRVPTASDSARGLCDDGFAQMARIGGLYRGDEPLLCHRALRDAEAALKADPRYLRASLLKASCLLRLGEAERLDECLRAARTVLPPENRIDVLTRLELEGDHLALVSRDFATAVTYYEKMLEIDPGHLRALWMLTAIHAGEFPPARWPGYSLEKAGDYAARLIVAHPDSAAARLLAASSR